MAAAGGRIHRVLKVKAEGQVRLIVFDTQDLSVGRSPDNDLAFDDPEMSRKHALFERTAEGCVIRDLRTPNGTDVNGEVVTEVTLSTGDVVRVGEVQIAYAETTRDPATLGKALEYASQLKSFASPMPQGDGESTMLGLRTAVSAGDAGDPDLDKAMELYPSRDLDAELADLDVPKPAQDGGDEPIQAERDAGDEPILAERDAGDEPILADRPGGDAPILADHVWELDESDPQAGAPEVARPPGTGTLTLRIELEGLDGELRRALEGLAGKLVELPRVRLKVESGD